MTAMAFFVYQYEG